MVKKIEGTLVAQPSCRFAIVVSRFNEFITKKLLESAEDTLLRHGVKSDNIEVVWVPGSFEIPFIAKKIASTKKVNAVICLGCIIQGETPHFEIVANQTSRGISQAELETGIPVIFGVITSENIEQAIDRAGTKMGNRGADAALTAIEMANLMEMLNKK